MRVQSEYSNGIFHNRYRNTTFCKKKNQNENIYLYTTRHLFSQRFNQRANRSCFKSVKRTNDDGNKAEKTNFPSDQRPNYASAENVEGRRNRKTERRNPRRYQK